jgi:outer membrane protein OmpA-like peptidoglycan-associated protein
VNVDLLSLAQDALGNDFSKLAGSFLGESASSTQLALTSLVPTVLGGVAQKGATPEGASSLIALINGANLDTSSLGNIAGLFGGGGSSINEMLKQGTSRLVPALFGDKSGALVNAASAVSGIKTSSATSLLAMVVPIILAFLKKFIGEKGLNAGSLSSLLAGQGPNLQGALDSRITGALGYASPAAFLGGLGGKVADTARRAGAGIATGAGVAASAAAGTAAMATTTSRLALARWLPWVIGAVVLLFLWNMLSSRSVATPTAPGGAPRIAAVSGPLPSKVYFDVGTAAIGAEGSNTIAMVAEAIKKENVKVVITGYTDKTGDTAKNEELARSRAAAVAAALKAAGIPENSIEMKPPIFVEIGIGMSDADARRVEINKS